jgi:DNA-directed RNA polymerase specialized sigma24 family protein
MTTEAPLTNMRHITKQRTDLYATGADFCRIFTDDMKNLYRLSLLLTADPEKAEECFVSGLDECATGNQVFREWGRSWAHRVVIKNAIRMIAPQPRENGVLNPAANGLKRWPSDRVRPELPVEISAVFDLPPFERFAFVMAVFEGYSDQDCALLLGCARESLIAARVRALRRIGSSVDGRTADSSLGSELSRDHRKATGELAFPATLATPA